MRFVFSALRATPLRAAVSSVPLSSTVRAHCGKHEEVQRYKEEANRCAQYAEAIKWCRENKKRGFAGANCKDEEGNKVWPLINENGLKRPYMHDTYPAYLDQGRIHCMNTYLDRDTYITYVLYLDTYLD